jgi:hypothetical protein
MSERMIVFYGNSLSLHAAAAGLEGRAGWCICSVDPQAQDVAAQLRALHPDAILFDAAASPPEKAITLLLENARLILVGVDFEGHRAVVLSGASPGLNNSGDLLGLLEAQIQRGETSDAPQTCANQQGATT